MCLSVYAIAENPLPGGLETAGWRAYRWYWHTFRFFRGLLVTNFWLKSLFLKKYLFNRKNKKALVNLQLSLILVFLKLIFWPQMVFYHEILGQNIFGPHAFCQIWFLSTIFFFKNLVCPKICNLYFVSNFFVNKFFVYFFLLLTNMPLFFVCILLFFYLLWPQIFLINCKLFYFSLFIYLVFLAEKNLIHSFPQK